MTVTEVFTHPNHGTTIAYKDANGRVFPVFRDSGPDSQDRLVSEVQRGILDYARDYCAYHDLHECDPVELLGEVKKSARHWVVRPSKDDAALLKDIFFSADWPRQSKTRLVIPLGMSDILSVSGLTRKVKLSLWPQGSLVLAPLPGLAAMYNLAATAKYAFQKKGRVPAS